MPAYNFQRRFIPKIRNGQKPHTIRRRRKYPTKVGDTLKLFTGMRTKNCSQFAEAKCSKVEPLVIWVSIRKLSSSFGTGFFSSKRVKDVALNDGFDSVDAFFDFFKLYKSEILEDFEIIYWDTKTMKIIYEV